MLDATPILTATWIGALTLIAAVTDARRGTIPNSLTLPILVTAPVAAALAVGQRGLCESLLGALVCGAVPLLLFRAGAAGGGDVKLLAAVGALAGAHRGLEIQLASFALATLWALLVLARRRQLWPTLARTGALVARQFAPARQRRDSRSDPAPMTAVRLGPAVFLASAIVLSASPLGWP